MNTGNCSTGGWSLLRIDRGYMATGSSQGNKRKQSGTRSASASARAGAGAGQTARRNGSGRSSVASRSGRGSGSTRSSAGRSGTGSTRPSTGRSGAGRESAARSAASRSAAARRSAGSYEDERIPVRSYSPSAQEDNSVVKRDIIVISLFAGMVFLFLSNFGILGPVGNVFSDLMFGLTGFTAYFLPIFIFCAVLFYYANQDNETMPTKLGAATTLFVEFGVIAELVAGRLGRMPAYDIADMYLNCVHDRDGGGVIAGTIAYVSFSLFKMFGTVLVLIIVTVICIVLITQRSIISFVGDTAASARERHALRMQELEEEARLAEADENARFRQGEPDFDEPGEEMPEEEATRHEPEEDYFRHQDQNPSYGEWMDDLRIRREAKQQERAERLRARGLARQQKAREREEERIRAREQARLNAEAKENNRILGFDPQNGSGNLYHGVQNVSLRNDPAFADAAAADADENAAEALVNGEVNAAHVAADHKTASGATGANVDGDADNAAGTGAVHTPESLAAAREALLAAGAMTSALRATEAAGAAASAVQTLHVAPFAGQDLSQGIQPIQPSQNAGGAADNAVPGASLGAKPSSRGVSADTANDTAQSLSPDLNLNAAPTGRQGEAFLSTPVSQPQGAMASPIPEADLLKPVRPESENLHEIHAEDYDSALTLQPDLETAKAMSRDTAPVSFGDYNGMNEGAAYGSDAFSSKVIGQGIGDAIDHETLDTVAGIVQRESEESQDLHSIRPEDYMMPYAGVVNLPGEDAAGETATDDTAADRNDDTKGAEPAYTAPFIPPDVGVRDAVASELPTDAAAAAAATVNEEEDNEPIDYSEIPVLKFVDDESIPQLAGGNPNAAAGMNMSAAVTHSEEAAPMPQAAADAAARHFDEMHNAEADVRADNNVTADSRTDNYAMTDNATEQTVSAFTDDADVPEAVGVSSDAVQTSNAAQEIPVHKEGVTVIADDIVTGTATPDELLRTKAQEAPQRSTEERQPLTSGGAGFTSLSGRETHEVKKAESKPRIFKPRQYLYPPMDLLRRGPEVDNADSANELRETAMKLQTTLQTFGVNVRITDISQGPAVTRYEMQPEQGVKVSKIVSLQDDIKLALAATDIRIEAPIPGKSAVGIEVPNKTTNMVALRDILDTPEFKNAKSKTTFGVGKDIAGKTVVADIAKMPHVLIAGATGSGKSVCINTIIMSILYHASPDEVKMIMIDPKVVELSVYNGIPHLLLPVVTDSQKAAATLNWCVAEMEQRFHRFADAGVRDIKGYNALVKQKLAAGIEDPEYHFMPHVVIIVDELADLMMVAKNDVETAICRLAQLARAAGMHLIIATQRPSVDVITGLIKANMPSRIAFAVTQGVDSRTILDMNGAEKLLGKGDMLFFPQGLPKPQRIQGAFVSDDEVTDVVNFLKTNDPPEEDAITMQEKLEAIANGQGGPDSSAAGGAAAQNNGPEIDELFEKAGKFIIEKNSASIGLLQRMFRIGFNRAARIMDQLCDAGVVSESEGTKPRKILMTEEEFRQFIEETM